MISEPLLCYDAVLNKLQGVPGGRLADLGCGTGEMLFQILREFNSRFQLYGLDISAESLKKAELRCGGRAAFIKGDVEKLPYPDESLDILLCMHSFHHYPRPRLALQEMRRVLVPGGRLYLVENLYSTYRRVRINLNLIIRRSSIGDVRMYSEARLNRMVRRAGFLIEEHFPVADHSQFLTCRKDKDLP